MDHPQQLAAVREIVSGMLGQVVSEVILVRDNFYFGRKFIFEAGYATWLLDEQQVKLYDLLGALVKTVALGRGAKRRAA